MLPIRNKAPAKRFPSVLARGFQQFFADQQSISRLRQNPRFCYDSSCAIQCVHLGISGSNRRYMRY
jgi:hypothetical protein